MRRNGLELHPSKCKAQTNKVGRVERGNVQLSEDFSLNVLPEGECLEVLGNTLSLLDPTEPEIENRIAIAWRKFWALKRLLLNKSVSRNRRLRLFDTTVGSSFLYGSHAWTPRAHEIRQMRTTQNRMLRKICGAARRPEEAWLDWIRRATHQARQLLQDAGVRDWVFAHARKKWLWAGHAMRRPASTWVWSVTSWRDHEWDRMSDEMGGSRMRRPSRRRWMRWEEPLWKYAGHSWSKIAAEKDDWNSIANVFAKWFIK